MILADTSIWVDHFRNADAELSARLLRQEIVIHSSIVGELALGSIRNRSAVLNHLSNLPSVKEAQSSEVLHMIEQRKLFARGIGYVDAQLIASCLLDRNIRLWTKDKRLEGVAKDLSLAI